MRRSVGYPLPYYPLVLTFGPPAASVWFIALIEADAPGELPTRSVLQRVCGCDNPRHMVVTK